MSRPLGSCLGQAACGAGTRVLSVAASFPCFSHCRKELLRARPRRILADKNSEVTDACVTHPRLCRLASGYLLSAKPHGAVKFPRVADEH